MSKNNNSDKTLSTTTKNQSRGSDSLSTLDQNIQNSISFYSDSNNVERKSFNKSNWYLATNDNINKKIQKFIKKMQTRQGWTTTDGLNTDGLNLYQISDGSKKRFKKLSKKADKLGTALWFEPIESEQVLYGTTDIGSIGEASIDVSNTPNHWNLYPTGTVNNSFGIDAIGAWTRANGEGVTVGISDTRHDLAHPDLISSMQGADNTGNGIQIL